MMMRCETIGRVLLLTAGMTLLSLPVKAHTSLGAKHTNRAGKQIDAALPVRSPVERSVSSCATEVSLRPNSASVADMELSLQECPASLKCMHCDWSHWEHARSSLPLLRSKPIASLFLAGTDVSVASLERLNAVERIKCLSLEGCWLDDNFGVMLDQATGLELLELTGCPITDAGLSKIAKISRLKALDLRGTLITDHGLTALTSLSQLERLDVRGTKVTQQGIERDLGSLEGLVVLHDARNDTER